MDNYSTPSGVLKNKLSINNANELNAAERRYSALRLMELMSSPIVGSFDFEHLKKIHKYIFQDIYDWAGKVRNVDIAKTNFFCRAIFIEDNQQRIFSELKRENLSGLNLESFCERTAYYFGELNMLHPFREGNGRTQREFIRQLADKNGYTLTFSKINEKEMTEASISSLCRFDNSGFKDILLRATTSKNREIKISNKNINSWKKKLNKEKNQLER